MDIALLRLVTLAFLLHSPAFAGYQLACCLVVLLHLRSQRMMMMMIQPGQGWWLLMCNAPVQATLCRCPNHHHHRRSCPHWYLLASSNSILDRIGRGWVSKADSVDCNLTYSCDPVPCWTTVTSLAFLACSVLSTRRSCSRQTLEVQCVI